MLPPPRIYLVERTQSGWRSRDPRFIAQDKVQTPHFFVAPLLRMNNSQSLQGIVIPRQCFPFSSEKFWEKVLIWKCKIFERLGVKIVNNCGRQLGRRVQDHGTRVKLSIWSWSSGCPRRRVGKRTFHCGMSTVFRYPRTQLNVQFTIIQLRNLPVSRIMWDFHWIASTDMGCCNLVRLEREVHQLIHVFHDYHIGVEQYDALR